MAFTRRDSNLLDYIASHHLGPGETLPTLSELSVELDISVGKLREQLEAARLLGLVDVRPGVGIRLQEFKFLPAIRTSLLMAVAQDSSNFEAFTELRNSVEAAFLCRAASRLLPEDKERLRRNVAAARRKLTGSPIQIPHSEHRELHLTVFRRLNNPFVLGILEAYWEAYEAAGLNVFADLRYHQEVWDYHEAMVEAIFAGDYEEARRLFVEHTGLLRQREEPATAPAPAVVETV